MSDESSENQGILARPIVALAAICGRNPWLVIAAVLVSCGLALALTNYRLTYQTHRNDLISKHKDYYQRWKKYIQEFGDDDDLVVVLEGTNRAQILPVLEEVAERVNADKNRFDRLYYQVDLRPLKNRALLFLQTEQLRAIQNHLKNMALLLDPPVIGFFDPLGGWKRLTFLDVLNDATVKNGPFNPQQNLQPENDPLLKQVSVLCKNAVSFMGDPKAYQSPWQSVLPIDGSQKDLMAEPWYFFSGDGTLAFLMARPAKDPSDGFTSAQKSIDALRTIIAEVGAKHSSVKLGLTGIPVLENDEMISTQNDSTNASWLALIGVALLYFVVYRGLRYPLMTVAALLVGTAWALGWLTLTVGHLNILSSAFAVMLIGMGDYGVLWVTRFGIERAGGATLDEANLRTAASVGPSILTAALATALAFFATMLADLKAVAELGWIAGSGVLLCAISTFVVMPALLALFDCKVQGRQTLPIQEEIDNHRNWLPGLMKRPGWVLMSSLAVTLVLGYYACQATYDHNLLNLQAPELDSVQWQQKILQKSPEGNLYAISTTNTPEEALALKERFEKLPGVSRVVEVATLVPREQDRKMEILRDLQERLRKLPARGTVVEHELPDGDKLVRAADQLLEKVLIPWQQNRPCVFLADLQENVRKFRDVLAGPDAGKTCERLRGFQMRMVQDLIADLHQMRDVATPAPITLADLPECLRQRYVGYTGKWLVAVFSKECLWEFANLQNFTSQIQTVDAEATGKPFSILEGLKAMQAGFLWAGVYALIAMVIVLLIDFGSVKHMLIAFLPLAMGMITALGVMALFGFTLNPANLIAFPLILGVGADNGVHVLHDYRHRTPGTRYLLSYCTGRGIMVSALTTILGFGTLMIAQHRGLASLGLALTLGVTACMITALVFLPALLGMLSNPSKPAAQAQDRRKHAA